MTLRSTDRANSMMLATRTTCEREENTLVFCLAGFSVVKRHVTRHVRVTSQLSGIGMKCELLTISAASSRSSQAIIRRPLAAIKAFASSTRVPGKMCHHQHHSPDSRHQHPYRPSPSSSSIITIDIIIINTITVVIHCTFNCSNAITVKTYNIPYPS